MKSKKKTIRKQSKVVNPDLEHLKTLIALTERVIDGKNENLDNYFSGQRDILKRKLEVLER